MSVKYCKRCGTPIQAGENFCPNCGQALQNTSSETPMQQAVQQPSLQEKKHTSTLKIVLIVGGIVVGLGIVLVIAVVLLLINPKSAVVTDDLSTEYTAGDDIKNDNAGQIYEAYSVRLISLDNSNQDMIGEEFVDVFKIRQDQFSELILDVSTPDFRADMYIKAWEEDQLFAEVVLESLEISYDGEIVDSDEIYSQGSLTYKNFNSGKVSVYEVVMYKDYQPHDESLRDYYGQYEFNYRDYYVEEGEITEDDQKNLEDIIEGYFTYQTSFDLNENSQGDIEVTFITDHNLSLSGTYLIPDTSEHSWGYLLETSNRYAVGEEITLHFLSHPSKKVYDGAFRMNLDNGAIVVVEFEGYGQSSDDEEESNLIARSQFSGSWISEDDFPLLAIIDEGSMKIPQELKYLPPYAGRDIILAQDGFIVHDTLDGVILKMPYSLSDGVIKVDITLYAGQEFVDGNFSAIYVKDASGQLYQSKEFNGEMKAVDRLPEDIYLFSQMNLTYELNTENQLELNGTIILYEDGADNIHNPDPSQGDEFKMQGILRPY